MNEFLILLFLLGMLTTIGHGIWVLVSKGLRSLGGKSKLAKPTERRREELPAAPLAMIERLMHTGKLDTETGERVLKAMRELLQEADIPQPSRPPIPPPISVIPKPPVPLTPVTPPPLPRRTIPVTLPPPPPAPSPPPRVPPAPTWKEGFNAFLEQSHIRWGELTGGLLIVGCSAALVLTFWSHIAGRWLAQALVFTGVTASLHGLGHYARRRWHLPDTTFGLLLIALLLTPLSFLLLSALGQGLPALDPLSLGMETLALVGLGFLQHHSLRGIVPRQSTTLSLTLIAQVLWILLLRRLAVPGLPPSLLLVLAAIPVVIQGLSTCFLLRREAPPSPSPRLLLLAHALGSYAMLLALALFLHLARIGENATVLAPLLALAGLPSWAMGLHLRRLPDSRDESLLISAGSLGFLGFGALIAALVVAWPATAALLPCLLLATAVLAHAGLRERFPFVGLPSGLCLGASFCLVAVSFLQPALWNSQEPLLLISALLRGGTGRSLALVAPLIALGAVFIFGLPEGRPMARGLLYAAALQAATALLQLFLLDAGRPGDPEGLLRFSAFYAIALLAAPWFAWLPGGRRMNLPLAQRFIHVGLFLAAFVLYRSGSDFFALDRHLAALAPALFAALLHIFLWCSRRLFRLYAAATLRLFAFCTLVALTPWSDTRSESFATACLVMGAAGLLLSLPGRRLALFHLAQCLLALGLCIEIHTRSLETVLPYLAAVAFSGLFWMLLAKAIIPLHVSASSLRLRRLFQHTQSLLRRQEFDVWSAILLPPLVVAMFALDNLSGLLREIQGGVAVAPLESSLLFVALLATLALHVAGRRRDSRIAAFSEYWLMLCAAGLALVFARLHLADNAFASALRWNLALLLALSAFLPRNLRRAGLWVIGLPLWILHILPPLLLGFFPETNGPQAASLFLRFGHFWNLALPLAMLSALVFLESLRQRRASSIFLAALFGNLNLWLVFVALPLRLLPHAVTWTQLSALWCGGIALVWLWKQGPTAPFARAQAALAFAWGLAGLCAALADLLFLPDLPTRALALSAPWILALWPLLWITLALRLGSRNGLRLLISPERSGLLLAGILLPASVLFSLRFLPEGLLFARHVLPLALLASAGFSLLLLPKIWRNASPLPSYPLPGLVWIPLTLCAILLLPILARTQVPSLPREWSAAPLAGVFALLLLPPILARIRNLETVYGSPNRWLFSAQGVLWILAVFLRLTESTHPTALQLLQDLSWAIVPTCAFAFALQRHDPRISLTRNLPTFTLLLSVLIVLSYIDTPNASTAHAAAALLVAAFPSVLALWDSRAPRVLMRLHNHSLIACMFFISTRTFSFDATLRALLLLPAALSLVWTLLFRFRHRLRPFLLRLRIHPPPAPRVSLLSFACLLSLLQLLIALVYLGVGLHSPDLSPFLRIAPLCGVLASAAAIGGLAQNASIRSYALTLATFAFQLALWSATASTSAPTGLRWLLLPLPLAAVLLLFRQLVSAHSILPAAWTTALHSVAKGWWLVALFLLPLELLWTTLGGWVGQAPHSWVLASALTIVTFAALHLRWALRPDTDLLGWRENAATRHVYAAEILAAGFFLHLRLYWPELFRGWFEPWWPAILMGLAFLGFGLGELFGRRGPSVLHKPLLRTGLFLPLFPLLSFWTGGGALDHSLIFLLMGILYAAASSTRGSYGLALLAVLATNSSLWHLLSRGNGLDLLRAPQLWILPPAFSVLLASRLHAHRLTPATRGSVRYLCLGVIYLSTSTEMFARGVANAPWLPLLLSGLSVLGILTGILLRIRSYLFCGAAFLLLSIFSMLAHASSHLGWTWIWYVAGIIAGLLLLLLFANFERQRNQRLDKLREWEP